MARKPYMPISRIGASYYLFHAPHIAEARSEHRIPGLLTGTLPQANQQNVFLGLPLQLMREEARLLVETGIAYVVDDADDHKQRIADLDPSRQVEWLSTLNGIGTHVTRELQDQKESEKQRAIGQLSAKAKAKQEKRAKDKHAKLAAKQQQQEQQVGTSEQPFTQHQDVGSPKQSHDGGPQRRAAEDTLTFSDFWSAQTGVDDHPQTPERVDSVSHKETVVKSFHTNGPVEAHIVTPTTSHPPLPPPPPSEQADALLPAASPSYALFKYLHNQSYFLSPGLRFGCQYMAYPGDPLRFHSHFMVVGREWDEEMDILSLIGVGRLGTGVKKGVLVGGTQPKGGSPVKNLVEHDSDDVRCFCIEWGGM